MSRPAPRTTVFLPSLDGGGAERSILLVANGLAARGWPVHLVLAAARGPYLADVDPRVALVDLRSGSVAGAAPALARHLRRTRSQVLLSAMSHANLAAVAAARWLPARPRIVLSERAHLGALLASDRGWRLRLTAALLRPACAAADRVVTVSEGVADDLAQRLRLPRGRFVTIHNPVVDERLAALAAQAPAHRWLHDRGPPVVLAAGRLVPQKDFATLIEAFARVRATRPLRLVILGEGALRADLQARAAALGVAADVDLPGFAANPFAEMRAAALFVLSSRFEGLPGVLVQAMACGTPVVSTDCPSGPAEVLDGGRWGRLVPVGDAAALARAMAEALDDPAPPDVRRRAADFSVARAVERYAAVLSGDDPA